MVPSCRRIAAGGREAPPGAVPCLAQFDYLILTVLGDTICPRWCLVSGTFWRFGYASGEEEVC